MGNGLAGFKRARIWNAHVHKNIVIHADAVFILMCRLAVVRKLRKAASLKRGLMSDAGKIRNDCGWR